MIRNLKLNLKAMVDSPAIWEGLVGLAGNIVTDANKATSAPVGITYNEDRSNKRILIGARGAAAYAVEFGHQGVPAKRYFKKTIDRYREG